MNPSLPEILDAAAANAQETVNDGRIDWGAYWEHARQMREIGLGWIRIYQQFELMLHQQGRKMPGDAESFSRAMSARWSNYKKPAGAAGSSKPFSNKLPKLKGAKKLDVSQERAFSDP